jgi:hypothetical protein
VSGIGVYSQASTYVPSGNISSGLITYGLADNKMPVFVDLALQPLLGGSTIALAVAYNGAPFANVGTLSQANSTFSEFSLPQQLAETVEIQETLNAGTSNTVTPTLTRHTLRAIPAPPVPTDLLVVIQLRERQKIRGVEQAIVPSHEYAYLDNLRANKTINTLTVGTMGPYQATLETIDWIPEQVASRSGEYNAVAVLSFRSVT